MNKPSPQTRLNEIAIKDLESGDVVVRKRLRSEDTSWNDARAIFRQFVESSYSVNEWTEPKNFLVFFRTEVAPEGLEVLPPSKMIARFIPEDLVMQRGVMGAPEWDCHEEIDPYQLDYLDSSELAEGEFPTQTATNNVEVER
jgi:hypothetical protein